MIFVYFHDFRVFSWFLHIFIIFAYFHDFCIFSWFLHIFMMSAKFYDQEVDNIFMIFCIFSWSLSCACQLRGFSTLHYISITLYTVKIVKICKIDKILPFSWNFANFMKLCENYELFPLCIISWFSHIFMLFTNFHEVGKISWSWHDFRIFLWFSPIFMKVAKFLDFRIFSWNLQNFMIFAYLHENFIIFVYFHNFYLFILVSQIWDGYQKTYQIFILNVKGYLWA